MYIYRNSKKCLVGKKSYWFENELKRIEVLHIFLNMGSEYKKSAKISLNRQVPFSCYTHIASPQTDTRFISSTPTCGCLPLPEVTMNFI